MKAAFLLVVTITFLAGCQSATQEAVQPTIENQESTPAETPPDSLIAQLSKTWYAKKIIVDGEEDTISFPTNNDELTLRSNMTYIAIDRTYIDTIEGNWKLINGSTIEMEEASSGETRSFGIEKLTEDSLITSLDDLDEAEALVVYSSRKD